MQSVSIVIYVVDLGTVAKCGLGRCTRRHFIELFNALGPSFSALLETENRLLEFGFRDEFYCDKSHDRISGKKDVSLPPWIRH